MDIPLFQITLRNRIARTAQQLSNRIVIQLTDYPKPVSTTSIYYTTSDDLHQVNVTMYTMGQKNGGTAWRQITPLGNKG